MPQYDYHTAASAGKDLSFQAVTRQVLSAQLSLTSVFGMGTGGTSALYTQAIGDPCGNRTRVTGVRGRCLDRLTNGPGTAFSGFARRGFADGRSWGLSAPFAPTGVASATQPSAGTLQGVPSAHFLERPAQASPDAAGLVRHQGLEPGTR